MLRISRSTFHQSQAGTMGIPFDRDERARVRQLRPMSTKPVQDQMIGNYCWGCGADNNAGLHLKSYWDGEIAVAEWIPSDEYAAGPQHFLNGGIIATLLDCHGVCTAIASAYHREARTSGQTPRFGMPRLPCQSIISVLYPSSPPSNSAVESSPMKIASPQWSVCSVPTRRTVPVHLSVPCVWRTTGAMARRPDDAAAQPLGIALFAPQ